MTWAWHKLQCCCKEEADCFNYIPCCVNGVEALWAIRNVPSGAGTETGIVKAVYLENLCNSSVGSNWSQYVNVGNPTSQAWKKEPATRNSVGSPPRSSFQTSFGCLTNVSIDSKHLVCPCEVTTPGGYNFKITVEVMSCVPPDPEPTTYYVEVPSAELCFDIGDGSATPGPQGPYDCCMILGGYSIDGGPIIETFDGDNWVPIVIADEDTTVKVNFFFKHDPDCTQCISSGASGSGSSVVADILETAVLTPQKECFQLACGRNISGFQFPFTPETFDLCGDPTPTPTDEGCKSSTLLGTKPNLDNRDTICYNCLWERDIFGGESYPNDVDCKCGCNPECSNLRSWGVGPANRGPSGGYCVSPGQLDSGNSNSSSATICIHEDISGGVDALIWHAIVPDGCPTATQEFSFSRYRGPNGSVSSIAANHPTGKEFGIDVQPSPCDKIDISWDNVVNGTDGGGNDCFDISMTIDGETWTVNNCPGASPKPTRTNLLWKVDHGC